MTLQNYTDASSTPRVLVGEWGVGAAHDGTENQDVAVKVEAAPPACEGITHVASFHAHAGNRDYFLRFGPTTGSVFEFILERHTH